MHGSEVQVAAYRRNLLNEALDPPEIRIVGSVSPPPI
jgi:hypothetical protein